MRTLFANIHRDYRSRQNSVTKRQFDPTLIEFLGHTDGVIAVEFALLISILSFVVACIVDLYLVSSYNRDIERSSAQIARIVANCTNSKSTNYVNCTTGIIQDYTSRKINMMIRIPSVQLQMLQVNKVSNQIRVCAGTSTVLQTDVGKKVIDLIDDKDVAIVVIMNYTYNSIFPKLANSMFGTIGNNIQSFAISVQVGNVILC